MVSCIFAGYLCYISYSALLFVNDYGVSKVLFPLYQASVLIAFVSASLSANRMLSRFGVETTKWYGLCLLSLGGGLFIVNGSLWPQSYNLFHIPMIFYSFGAGWLMGPYFTECMEALPDIKGTTASLATSFRLLFTAGFIAMVSRHYQGSPKPMVAGFVALLAIGGVTTFLDKLAIRKRAMLNS